MAVQPTAALAEGLRELAQAAYGDPNAKWENPQALIRDALRATRTATITPQSTAAALAFHNSQAEVMFVLPAVAPEHQEAAVDRWLIGMLSAALGASPNADPAQVVDPLTLNDMSVGTHANGTHMRLEPRVRNEQVAERHIEISASASDDEKAAGQAMTVLTATGYIADEAARIAEWKRLIKIMFGQDAQPYIDRLA